MGACQAGHGPTSPQQRYVGSCNMLAVDSKTLLMLLPVQPYNRSQVGSPSNFAPVDLPGVVELHNNPGGLGPVDALQIRLQPLVLRRAVLIVGPPVKEERKSAWQAMILLALSSQPCQRSGVCMTFKGQDCSHIVAQRDDVGATCTRSRQTEQWWL